MLLEPKKKLPTLNLNPPKVVEKHLHEYVRSSQNKNIYRCVDPDCSHYQNKIYLEGKRARCTKCKEEWIITKDQLENKTPVCIKCSKSKKSTKINKVMNILEGILK